MDAEALLLQNSHVIFDRAHRHQGFSGFQKNHFHEEFDRNKQSAFLRG